MPDDEKSCPPHLVPHQFKPGQSGNPNGRPKGSKGLTALLRRALREKVQDKKTGVEKELAEVLIAVAIKQAAKGKFQFFKEIMDRCEGKVVEKHELVELSAEATPQAAQEVMRQIFGAVTPTEAEESEDDREERGHREDDGECPKSER